MARQRIDLPDVLGVATTLLDTDGLEALTLGRVAEELGVGSPALYNHIDGLDALRRLLAERANRRLAELLRDAAVGRSGGVAVRAVAHAYRDFAREHPGQYAATLLPASNPACGSPEPQAEIVRVLARILEGYGLHDDHAVHGARIVRSAVHGFVTLEATESFVHPQDHDESFTALVDFVIAGLDAGLLA